MRYRGIGLGCVSILLVCRAVHAAAPSAKELLAEAKKLAAGQIMRDDMLERTCMWQARTGDLVEVELADGRRATYRVTEVRPLVEWDDLSVLAPSPTERLTLQTCVWYDLTSPRLVVIAEPATTAS